MKQRIPFISALIVWSLLMMALPVAAADEYKEAVRQTEDEWKAVRGTLKEGKDALDDFMKKYDEYHDAVFSGAPEEGLELARKLFNLDQNDTMAAENRIGQLRRMFNDLDKAGVSDKIEAASRYLDTANNYAGEAENLWEFTKKFNPDHAKDNPTYGLRLIGSLLTESAGKLEAIPLVGEVLGKWVKAYGEVAGDFANALDRLDKKIDDFRGGSLCGQLGKRQGQQAAFTAAGGRNCLTYFASGIFPRLQGETYEGDSDYFLYDPATERGYLASKEADIVYRWHERLLEHRTLDPAWLAGRANSLKPQIKRQARAAYVLFHGLGNKTEPGWVILDKLGLYQDAYFYGRLDERTFMGNYILAEKHHSAVNAVLREYEKYVLVRGTVYEDTDGAALPAGSAQVEFTVGGRLFSAITTADGRYEILITGQVNDPIHEKITKIDFEPITGDGRLTGKVISGLDYTLTSGSLAPALPGLSGSTFLSRDLAGNERITSATAGQEVYLQTVVSASDLDRSDTVLVDLEVLLPDGLTVAYQPPGVPVRPGQLAGYGTAIGFVVEPDYPPGTCHVTGTLRLGDQAVPLDGMTFEIEKLDFQIGELMISPGPDLYTFGTRYAVGDPIHLQVDLTGVRSGAGAPITGLWQVTLPDGRLANPQETRLLAAEGVSGALMNDITTNERTPLGLYRVEVVVSYEGSEVARRSGTFELAPLFENPEILITDTEENPLSLEAFRPADAIFVLARMTYNSVDPARQVHLTVDFEGPDPGIRGLGFTGDQSFSQGPMVTGVSGEVPRVIQEGYYTATVTLDGGAGQRLTLQGSFRIVHPVQFDAVIWTRDGLVPPQRVTRYQAEDPFEWFMQYHFVETRPGDKYASAAWCHVGDMVLDMLSSDTMGPDTPFPGPGTTSYTGFIPLDMPAGTYEVSGVVWYNDVAYRAPANTFMIGQEPTITITSPQSGFTVDEKVLVVTGTCADRELEQARMFTNGESIPVKLRNGEFSTKTVLRPGQNEIHVVAQNEVGTSEARVWGTANIQAAALKIVLTWEATGTDIDLWVTDPQGVTTNYQNKRPAEGRQLDVDDRSGPGMETYTVEVPLRGQYQVAVHYFGAGGWQGAVPFNLQITTWETTFNENHGSTGGTLYKAAGNRDESGAVEYFTIPLQ